MRAKAPGPTLRTSAVCVPAESGSAFGLVSSMTVMSTARRARRRPDRTAGPSSRWPSGEEPQRQISVADDAQRRHAEQQRHDHVERNQRDDDHEYLLHIGRHRKPERAENPYRDVPDEHEDR